MKKLISISIALALMVSFMAPMTVAADGYDVDPGAYSKTPFAILGSAIQLVGTIVSSIPMLADMIPFDVAAITDPVGEFAWVNVAWMTDMTAWSMVAVGDVLSVIVPLADVFDAGDFIGPVADVFYVLGARLLDEWDTIKVAVMVDELPAPGLGLPVADGAFE